MISEPVITCSALCLGHFEPDVARQREDGRRICRGPQTSVQGDATRVPVWAGKEQTDGGRERVDGVAGGAAPEQSAGVTNAGALWAQKEQMRKLVAGYIRESVQPQLDRWGERSKNLKANVQFAAAGELGDRKVLASRLEKLRKWQRRAAVVLPTMGRLLG